MSWEAVSGEGVGAVNCDICANTFKSGKAWHKCIEERKKPVEHRRALFIAEGAESGARAEEGCLLTCVNIHVITHLVNCLCLGLVQLINGSYSDRTGQVCLCVNVRVPQGTCNKKDKEGEIGRSDIGTGPRVQALQYIGYQIGYPYAPPYPHWGSVAYH